MSTGGVALVATDMDGTLLRGDHTISDRTVAALSAAAARGIHVVAATGRGWRSAVPLLAPVPVVRYAVCSNGSQTRDLESGLTIEERALAPDVLEAVLAVVDEVVPDRGIFWERASGQGCDAVYQRLRDERLASLGRPPEPLAAPQARPTPGPGVLKVLVNHPDLAEADLLDRLGPAVPAGAMVSSSGGGLVEITGAGVHKAAALDRLCTRLGVDAASAVAFGDNVNDREMLAWAGRGVAMGNAAPEVQAVADEVTATNDDDGVAVVVEALVAALGRDDVIRLSPPGFGAPVPADFVPVRSGYVDWLSAELEAIGGDVDLVGHDWGAGHTAGLVTTRPELVRSWAMDVAGIVHREYEWHDTAQLWRTPEVGEQVIESMVSASQEDKAALFVGLGMPADVAARIAAGNDETMGRCILSLYRSADPEEMRVVWDALATARQRPGLVLVPLDDHYAGPPERAREVATRAGADVAELPGQGHWWMAQDPAGAAAVLEAFWAQHEPRHATMV